ncbi:Ankyrin repeat domain protein [Wolbachia endosymbiont of Drosophila simulans wNo]|uniref:ankyrin repeat domain-containing protein n=1 Tax=Wolbachia endosymbiont of Drosophila simulans TaxID=77038 RepID=UPI0002D253DC|nr:ankyrin repeat domain-containing protein [Wolbachia endosymbiont of Drosophila simulans]AGJ98552.1 Ankyrin repeat domain protein [Wolbachia endosymbiont of Drosophila simulans wNo]
MTLILEQWKEILDAVIPNEGDILEQIKENLKKKHPEIYQAWEREDFTLNCLFCVESRPDGYIIKRLITLLHVAIIYSNLKIVRALLEKGIDVNIEGTFNETPLHGAARVDNFEIVKALLENGANVNAKGDFGYTPLHLAVEHDHLEIVKYLIENKADINAKSNFSYTPLHLAVKHGHLEIVKYLVENKADINVKDKSNTTPLYYADASGHLETLNAILKNIADINAKDHYDNTLLHTAASDGKLRMVEALLENGADINARNHYNFTPLHSAIENGQIETVKLLLNRRADINVKDNRGSTLLHEAARVGDFEIVNALLENGIDINVQNNNGDTPLHEAACACNFEIVNALLENGIDINVEDNDGKTPLQEAVKIEVAEPIVNQIAKLETIGSYVSEKNLQQRDKFINTSRERQGNYSQHLQNCKKEVEKMEKENKPLHDFLRENDVNKMTNIWKENEGVRNKFNNESNLKAQYPEYAHILINKTNKIKGIFLHNHKPLISILEKNYKCNFKTMTFYNINNFFEIHKNDIIVKMAAIEKSLIEFIDFKNFGKREVPRLDLYAFVQSIKNELADSKHSEASSSLLENSNAEAVVNQGQYYNLR